MVSQRDYHVVAKRLSRRGKETITSWQRDYHVVAKRLSRRGKETITSWQRDWISETRGRASFRHTPKPSRKVLDLHDGLSKKHSALLTQLRTEKIGLKDFLYNRKVPGISSNRCPCGSDRQTVAHVLLRCRQYRQLRDQELGRLRGRNNLRKLLNERKAAAKAIKFIELTQILGQFQDRDLN